MWFVSLRCRAVLCCVAVCRGGDSPLKIPAPPLSSALPLSSSDHIRSRSIDLTDHDVVVRVRRREELVQKGARELVGALRRRPEVEERVVDVELASVG